MNFGSVPFVAAATPAAGGLLTETDNFNRADGALGANWAVPVGTCAISSNQISFSNSVARYIGATFDADQECDLVIGSPGVNHCGGAVRLQADGSGYISSNELDSANIQIYRFTAPSTYVSVVVATGLSLVSGDRIGVRAVGSTISVIRNGVVVASATDATYSSGQPGCYGFFNTGDDWRAAEI